MEPEASLLHLKAPAMCSYPEPSSYSPYHNISLWEIHLNITHPSTCGSSRWSLSLMIPHQNPVYTSLLSHTFYIPTLKSLNLITQTILDEQHRSLSSSLYTFLHSSVTSSLLGPNILLNTLFSNILSLHSSHNISYQVSHPYNSIGKIILLYIWSVNLRAKKLIVKQVFYTRWKFSLYFGMKKYVVLSTVQYVTD